MACVDAEPIAAVREAWRVTGYEHLAPLFAERSRLPADHPRQQRLRAGLITSYLPVAQHIARRYGYRGASAGIGLDDLEQVARVGLILAVDRFDPGRDIDFLSFAVPTITGEVLRHFRDRSAAIRMPRRLHAQQASIFNAASELGQRHGRAPRPSEIARYLDVDVELVLETLQAQETSRTSSLDELADGERSGGVGRGRLDAVLGHVEPEFELVEYRQALASLLAELPDRERTILLLRFFGGMTQTQIGDRVGISQMHVSRLLTRTLSELRRRLTA